MYRTYASACVTLPRGEGGGTFAVDTGWLNESATDVWEHIKVMQRMYGDPVVVRTSGLRTRYVWERVIGTGARLVDTFVYVREGQR